MTKENDQFKSEVAQMLEKQRDRLAIELDALDDLSSKAIAEARKSKEYDVKLGSHIAWITGKRAEVLSHLRQLEKHDRLQSRTPAQRFQLVRAYIENEATPPQRAELFQLLAELDSGRSVLA